jgi:integrase/recombinase XerD
MKIISHKTSVERVIYFSDKAIKDLKKYFELPHISSRNNEHISQRLFYSQNNPSKELNHLYFIKVVNKYIQTVLGKDYSSHSFRSGIITDMMKQNTNPKVVQSFIGHKNVQTTLGYYAPTKSTIRNSLVR